MSISQNFPIVSPSLNLDFANTKVLDSRITFSRPTSAVYYDGQTVTKAEENLFTYSQEFDNAYWSTYQAGVTANTTIAPDGTTTAETLTNASTDGAIYRVYGVAGTYTTSIFAHAATTSTITLDWSTSGNGRQATFDLIAGTATAVAQIGTGGTVTGGTSSIVNIGNGWYRCIISDITVSSTNAFVIVVVGASTSSVYLWGAQLEQHDTVTAYQPTTTQPITNYIPTLLTAPANTARFDHNPVTGESLGLLVEEQRTNLLTYSEDFDNASWSKNNVTVTANTIVAPDGSLTSDKVIANVGINFHSVIQNPSITPSTVYTLSCFLKRGEYQYGFLYSDGATKGAIFDLDSLTVTGSILGVPTSSTIVDAGNGWARCSITFTSGVSTFSNTWVGPTSSPTSANIAGDGYSGIYIWGAQLEAGAFPTSYIKTEASQVTRSADSASITGANFSDWYRQDEGSFYAEASWISRSQLNQSVIGLDTEGSNVNWFGVGYAVGGFTNSNAAYNVNGVFLQNLSSVTLDNTFYKFAIALKTNDVALTTNSSSIANDTSGYIGSVNRFRIGTYLYGAMSGHIKKIAYYPQRLSNINLQALTS